MAKAKTSDVTLFKKDDSPTINHPYFMIFFLVFQNESQFTVSAKTIPIIILNSVFSGFNGTMVFVYSNFNMD